MAAGGPAAQHERAEMALLIDQMLRLESVLFEAGVPGLPIITAYEAAGYFWLQLHAYEDSGHAFEAAARRVGQTPHVILGVARTARGRQDFSVACGQYTRLLSWWGTRRAVPAEIAEAREYIAQPQCQASPGRR